MSASTKEKNCDTMLQEIEMAYEMYFLSKQGMFSFFPSVSHWHNDKQIWNKNKHCVWSQIPRTKS